jgi:glutaredoxin
MDDAGSPPPARRVTVVSRQGCHLCERVIGTLASLSSRHRFALEVLDLQDHPELRDRYILTIPVVRIDGRDVFDARDMTLDLGYAQLLEKLIMIG